MLSLFSGVQRLPGSSKAPIHLKWKRGTFALDRFIFILGFWPSMDPGAQV